MNDDYLTKFQKQPHAEFTVMLWQQLAAESQTDVAEHRRVASRATVWWVAMAAALVLIFSITIAPRANVITQTPLAQSPFDNLSAITPDNAAQLTELKRVGRGIARDVAWHGNTLAVAAASGVWLHNSDDFTLDANQLPTDDALIDVEFSPNGSLIAGYGEAQLHVWDMRTGDDVFRINVKPPRIDRPPYNAAAIAFSHDAQLLAAIDGDTVRILDARTGETRRVLNDFTYGVLSIDFSPVDDLLATSGCFDLRQNNGSTTCVRTAFHLWDVSTGEELATVTDIGGQKLDVLFSPSGTDVAVVVENGIRLWDVASLLDDDPSHDEDTISDFTFITDFVYHPDGTSVTTSGFADHLRVFDLINDGQSQLAIDARVAQLAYSPDGGRIAVSEYAGDITILDTTSADVVATLTDYEGLVLDLMFAPDDRRQLISAGDGNIRVWNAEEDTISNRFDYHTFRPFDALFDYYSDGSHFVYLQENNTVIVVDLSTGEMRELDFSWPDGGISMDGIAVLPDESILAYGSLTSDRVQRGGQVVTVPRMGFLLWDAGTDMLLTRVIESPFNPFGPFALNVDRTLFAAASDGEGNQIAVWDLTEGTLLQTWQSEESIVFDITFTPGSDALLMTRTVRDFLAEPDAKSATLFDLTTGDVLQSWQGEIAPVSSPIFNADGSLLLAGDLADGVHIWEVATGERLMTINQDAFRIALSADNTLLALSDGNGLIRLYGVAE